jgi:hypothetical protein
MVDIRISLWKSTALAFVQVLLFLGVLWFIGIRITSSLGIGVVTGLCALYTVIVPIAIRKMISVRLDEDGIAQFWPLYVRKQIAWPDIQRIERHGLFYKVIGESHRTFIILPVSWLLHGTGASFRQLERFASKSAPIRDLLADGKAR